MTENKRFTLKNWNDYAEGDCIYYDDGEEMGSLDVLDALNSLSKENEQLKNEKESWKKSWIEEMEDQEEQSKCILRLVKENEELKGRVHGITREYRDWKFSAKKFQKKYQSAVKLLRVIKHELMTLNNLRLVDSNNDLVYVNFNDLLEKIEGEQLLGVIGDCEELNRLYKENKKLKTAIKEAYENERTDLGRSVLKQLANNLEIEV